MEEQGLELEGSELEGRQLVDSSTEEELPRRFETTSAVLLRKLESLLLPHPTTMSIGMLPKGIAIEQGEQDVFRFKLKSFSSRVPPVELFARVSVKFNIASTDVFAFPFLVDVSLFSPECDTVPDRSQVMFSEGSLEPSFSAEYLVE